MEGQDLNEVFDKGWGVAVVSLKPSPIYGEEQKRVAPIKCLVPYTL